MSEIKIKKTVFDIFVDGARKGWNVGISSILPNVLMAFVLIQILQISGLLAIIGKIFTPLMLIFGLPGEAVTVLMGGWLSMGGGTGVAAKLYADGVLSVPQLAIMLPAIYLMGSQVQYLGRVLGTAGIKSRYYGVMIIISIVNAFLSMLVMKVIITVIS